MGEILKPETSEKEEIQRISKELQISEERAKKLLQSRKDIEEMEKKL